MDTAQKRLFFQNVVPLLLIGAGVLGSEFLSSIGHERGAGVMMWVALLCAAASVAWNLPRNARYLYNRFIK